MNIRKDSPMMELIRILGEAQLVDIYIDGLKMMSDAGLLKNPSPSPPKEKEHD